MNKKLYRSKKQKVLGGICGGLAEYFDQDVVAWRIGVIALFILTGFMPLTLVYIVAWIIIPEAPDIEYVVSN